MNEQQQIPMLETREPTDEERRLVTLFTDLESKQLEFLDESGKSIIERIATFLAVLFGVTVLGNTFPPAYLVGNVLAKVLVVTTLAFYLLALSAGLWCVQPHSYKLYRHNLTGMREELDKIIDHKSCWLRRAGVLFAIGSVSLAALIISIIFRV
jgi:formate hydrogenlyase subunit 4